MVYVQSGSSNRLQTLSATTSTQICNQQPTYRRRTQLILSNTSAAASITIAKGEASIATASAGIVLLPNGIYAEATDSGYLCWQGAVQAYASAAGQLSIVESFEDLK